MMLRWLQKTGHRPIALMGGGTSKIGDPSGKDTSRTLLTAEQIDANIASIRTVFSRFLDFGAGAIMANNADWLDQLHYIPFLRDVGRHFTINKMLTVRFGEAAARSRAAADVSRIQLHDSAGLRFR
jgi:tyrosyl-tRNA synthetase